MNLKAINGWTDKSFTELLQLLKDMLLEGNSLPNRNYEAKKILCPMGMEYGIINDFPAYGNLSGYSVKGHKACPICEEETASQQSKHGRKTVYLRHRRFLRSHHPYRRLKKAFNGHQEGFRG